MNLRCGVALLAVLSLQLIGDAGFAETGILLPLKDRVGDAAVVEIVEETLKVELGWNQRLVEPHLLRNALRRLRIRDCDTATQEQLVALVKELDADWLFSATLHQGPTDRELQLSLSGRVYRPDDQALVWAGFESASGLDSRRVLGLGAIENIRDLAATAVRRLVTDFESPSDDYSPTKLKRARTDRGFLSDQIEIGRDSVLAVVPFDSITENQSTAVADTISSVALSVTHREGLKVLAPHLVTATMRRQGQLLRGEVDGSTRRALRSQHHVDLILTGTVESFETHRGSGGEPMPRLAFGARLIEADTGRIVWIDGLQRTGWDRQRVFGTNRTYVSGALALEMMESMMAGVFLFDDRSTGVAKDAASSDPEDVWPADVLATVNGETITLRDLERSLDEVHSAAMPGARRSFDIDRLMFKMVNDLLIAQEAQALGLHLEEPVAEAIQKYRDTLLVQRLEQEAIQTGLTTTSAEVREVFEDRYRSVTLRVVTTEDHESAMEVLEHVQGGADMALAARQWSIDPYTLRGGLMVTVPRKDLAPQIAELAFDLAPGQIGGPVRTDLGWSVLRVEAFEDPDEETYVEVQRDLREVVRMRKASAARSAFTKQLRDRYPVIVDQSVVAGVRPHRLTDGRLVAEIEDGDVVVARVGTTETITAGHYARALRKRWAGVRNEQAAMAAAPIVLARMVELKLMLVEARSRGYADDVGLLHAIRVREIQLLVTRYLEEVIASKIEVQQEEVEAYYEDKIFPGSLQIRVGQITVSTLEEADRVAEMLHQGGDFGWLARQHSEDRFAERGGGRGWVDPGRSGFEEMFQNASVGEVIGPIGAEGNFVLFEVRERRQTEGPSFEEVEESIRSELLSRTIAAAIEDLMTKLRARSEIRIDETALASLKIESEVGETPDAGGSGGIHAE